MCHNIIYNIDGIHIVVQGDQPISEDEIKECVKFTKEYIVLNYSNFMTLDQMFLVRSTNNGSISIHFVCVKEDVLLFK